jgi:predicted phosphodiesterase
MSKVGLMPNEVLDPETETLYKANPVQKAILEKWVEMKDHVKEIGGVHNLFHGGDWIDGPDVKGKGYAPVCSDIALQCDTMVNMVKELNVLDKRLITVTGSYYHVGKNLSAEQYIVQQFKGLGWKASLDPDVLFSSGGVTFHGKHSMTVGTSMWMYKATHIAKEHLLTVLNARHYCEGFGKDIDIVLRGHTHTFVYVGHKHKVGVSLPCWKGRDDFVRERYNDNPDLGYVIFYCDDGEFNMEKHVFSLSGDNVIRRIRA